NVTGVQTCALPICPRRGSSSSATSAVSAFSVCFAPVLAASSPPVSQRTAWNEPVLNSLGLSLEASLVFAAGFSSAGFAGLESAFTEAALVDAIFASVLPPAPAALLLSAFFGVSLVDSLFISLMNSASGLSLRE